MASVICTYCTGSFHISSHNFNNNVQCDKCGKILRVVISSGYVESVLQTGEYGSDVKGLPADIQECYEETRRCMGAECYTAAELLCRKILMHVAVEKRAKPGLSFAAYLNYLQTEGYVAKHMEVWVDLIRKHGNEATHSIIIVNIERAESTLNFTSQLLTLIYEMPLLAKKYAPPVPKKTK